MTKLTVQVGSLGGGNCWVCGGAALTLTDRVMPELGVMWRPHTGGKWHCALQNIYPGRRHICVCA